MKDKPDAWMPLYIGDWESGTRHLDCEQDGAYGRLVRHYWRNGPLPDDDGALARIVGMAIGRWRKVRPVLVMFFTVKDGLWFQKRVDAELERWRGKRAKAIEKAEAAARKRWGNDASSNAPSMSAPMLGAMLEQCPSASPRKERASKKALSLPGRECADERAMGSSPPRAWNGPEEIWSLIAADRGEAYAESWLGPCTWQDVPERMIFARTQIGADRLWRDFKGALLEREISIGRRAA